MLHWFVGFLRREKICIFGRLRLGIISVELSVPVVGLFSPLREYLRGSRELEMYPPGILCYVEIKPATSKYSKIRL